ncbi:MAG: PEP-CTERM sorting domain-containing protein [Phenylobacterium sp.]
MAGAIAAALVLSAGAANAAKADLPGFAPNYTFGDGAKGFALTTSGGPINPGVIVGFNPQPDPPGFGDRGALIGLLNPADPLLFSPAVGGSFTFLIGLLMPGDGSVLPLPDAPNADGRTGRRYLIDDHVIDIGLFFSGPTSIDPGSWVGFNPQPEPPGDVLGVGFSFQAQGDPYAGFNISIDGKPLDFALAPGVPEPAAWSLMLLGFTGLGAKLRSRRRALAAA